MSESSEEKVSRVEQMILDDGDTWDLSPNDKDALRHVLSRIKVLQHERDQCVSNYIAVTDSLDHRATELEQAYREGWADGAATAPKFSWQDGQVDIDWGQSETCSKLTKQG
jgi:hypothetical protein